VTIERATAADHADAFAIAQEYFEAIDVVVRDDPDDLREYLEEPAGMWLARDERGEVVGCIVLRPLPALEGACEIKRMYVRDGFRGRGLARGLLDAAHAHARARGFRWAYLDTKDDLPVAIGFYERRGYERCQRYNDNPQATIFMRRSLAVPD